jgi:hypothetical protein
MPGGGEVSGRVLGPGGDPVSGAMVLLRPATSGRFFQGLSTVDGSFRIAAVSDGDYTVTADAEGFAESEGVALHAAGQPVSGLELRLGTGAVLTGRLIGFAPSDLPSVTVRAYSMAEGPASFRVGQVAEESYRIGGLRAGPWSVSATRLDGRMAQGSVTVAPGTDRLTLDLELPSGLTLTGRVLAGGAPVAEAAILARETGGTGGTGRAQTAWDGSFRMPGLKPGHYQVAVAGPDLPQRIWEIDLTADLTLSLDLTTGAVSP